MASWELWLWPPPMMRWRVNPAAAGERGNDGGNWAQPAQAATSHQPESDEPEPNSLRLYRLFAGVGLGLGDSISGGASHDKMTVETRWRVTNPARPPSLTFPALLSPISTILHCSPSPACRPPPHGSEWRHEIKNMIVFAHAYFPSISSINLWNIFHPMIKYCTKINCSARGWHVSFVFCLFCHV